MSRPNIRHYITHVDVWEARNIVVNCVVLVRCDNEDYVLCSKRGPDKELYNVPAGYLDWDETATEAVYRETRGLDLEALLSKALINHLNQPWLVNSDPSENKQNVTLVFGVVLRLNELPELTCNEENLWMPVKYVFRYKWAFKHDELIVLYYNNVKLRLW